ncbi:cobalamin 5'-phosphate synthase [Saccharospirillum sp. MSK14-1]|uniref:adenosylcobinamide-GDP ribazoletransferase n=1 Tax=Saccharospirillum sp. MSK14-1 TaxID=1897632 RepID=UPI000D34643F|nr:adenosylcobinamide-GDP ribazoletransferase [Saccharospirillum sp. MSK14-1]PTY35666.1 cobalamin 5'-phosphate synthase [Saccharospirillum sp. MSK14-1]
MIAALARQYHAFFNAWVFFTRLPAPPKVVFNDDHLNQGSRYFSWIGLIIGVLLAVIFYGLQLVLPVALAVGLMLGASLLLTGAFHEDGLADVFDGLGGGFSKEAALTIMKDSRLGTYGAAALIVTLGLRGLALFEVLTAEPMAAFWLLPLLHCWSRFWAISTLWTLDYARADASSKSKPLATRFGLSATIIAALPLVLIAVLPWQGALWALLLAVFLRAVLVGWFRRRLDGYTGDCLGAAQQLQELLLLLVWVALGV